MEPNKSLDAAFEVAIGASVYAVVRGLVDAGMTPNNAMRLAAYVVVDGALGRGAVLELGVEDSTERRWRRQIRKALEDSPIREELPTEVLNSMLPRIGLKDFEVRQRGQASE